MTGYTVGGLDGNTSSGYWDIFLTKYNSSGIKLWTKQLGVSNQHGKDVADSWKYLCDWLYCWWIRWKYIFRCKRHFLVKYDSSGTKQWTKQLGTSSIVRNSVTTDSSGNIYVTELLITI